uniref:Uncharacterized protein n=1 Tax=Xenopus tropicalis TaxID=8364 RepID=A0A803J986_XENTR
MWRLFSLQRPNPRPPRLPRPLRLQRHQRPPRPQRHQRPQRLKRPPEALDTPQVPDTPPLDFSPQAPDSPQALEFSPQAPDSPQAKRWAPGPSADEGPPQQTEDLGTQTTPGWTDPTLRSVQEDLDTIKAQLAQLQRDMDELKGSKP